MERRYYVYIMSSLSRRLYVGMTNNLARRIAEHKSGLISGIAREKEVKSWRRSRKTSLIESVNPTWADLAEDWAYVKTPKEQIPRPRAGLGMTINVAGGT